MARRLHQGFAALVVLVGIVSIGGKISTGLTPDDRALMPAAVVITVAGIVLVLKVPGNAVSWILAAVAAGAGLLGLVEVFGSVESSNFVGGLFIFGLLIPGLGVLLPLLFPTGRPLSRGWRWVGRVCVLSVGVMLLGFVLQAALEGNLSSDVGCEGVGSCMAWFGLMAVLGCVLLAVASFVIRWRRSAGVEREQLRWLVLPFLVLMGALVAEFSGLDDSWIVLAVLGLGLFLVPVAIGVAVTRYRLYEIDRVISRTLAYILLVGLLGVLYAAGALWLPSLVMGEEAPAIFVAGSTLAVAALFNPLRRRLQRLVDRRFNRARYDAERVTAEFGSHLRVESDLGEIVEGWLRVVDQTMRPSALGVWVRP